MISTVNVIEEEQRRLMELANCSPALTCEEAFIDPYGLCTLSPRKKVIVLAVHIHCQGCADKVIKALRGFEGVDEIDIDSENHMVTVKGRNADPIKVTERLRKKFKKQVDLIYPIVRYHKEEKICRPEEPTVVVVVLSVHMHCEGCAQEIKFRLQNIQGVKSVETDLEMSQVTVKGVYGAFDSRTLLEYIYKTSGKHAMILKETPPTNYVISDCVNDDNIVPCYDKIAPPCYNSPHGILYAPQYLAEENPNACSIM